MLYSIQSSTSFNSTPRQVLSNVLALMPPGRRAAPFPRALLFLGCYVKGTKEGEELREKAHESQAEGNSDFSLEMALQDVYLQYSCTITSILDLG